MNGGSSTSTTRAAVTAPAEQRPRRRRPDQARRQRASRRPRTAGPPTTPASAITAPGDEIHAARDDHDGRADRGDAVDRRVLRGSAARCAPLRNGWLRPASGQRYQVKNTISASRMITVLQSRGRARACFMLPRPSCVARCITCSSVACAPRRARPAAVLRASRGCGRRDRALSGRSLETTRQAAPSRRHAPHHARGSRIWRRRPRLWSARRAGARAGRWPASCATHHLLLVAAAERVRRRLQAGGLDAPLRQQRLPERRSRSRAHDHVSGRLRAREARLCRRVRLKSRPWRWRSSGTSTTPPARPRARRRSATARPSTRSCPPRGACRPTSVSSSSDRPDPTRPNTPTISPARSVQRDAREARPPREGSDEGQPRRGSRREGAAGSRGGRSRPTIARTTSRSDLRAAHRAHVGAVAQDGDPVAQAEDLGQPMRDVDQGQPALPRGSPGSRTGDRSPRP